MITQSQTISFLAELYGGTHDLDTDTLKIALYTSSASIGPTTTAYTTTGEVTGTGYSAGGATLAAVTISSSSEGAWITFTNPSWAFSTITARGAMIYNSTKANRSIAVLDFGSDKTSTNSTFLITLPTAAASTAIIRASPYNQD